MLPTVPRFLPYTVAMDISQILYTIIVVFKTKRTRITAIMAQLKVNQAEAEKLLREYLFALR